MGRSFKKIVDVTRRRRRWPSTETKSLRFFSTKILIFQKNLHWHWNHQFFFLRYLKTRNLKPICFSSSCDDHEFCKKVKIKISFRFCGAEIIKNFVLLLLCFTRMPIVFFFFFWSGSSNLYLRSRPRYAARPTTISLPPLPPSPSLSLLWSEYIGYKQGVCSTKLLTQFGSFLHQSVTPFF